MIQNNAPVALSKCESYDKEGLVSLLTEQFEALGIGADFFRGKKVVLKPNLVRRMDPALAGTTHPALVEAVGEIIRGAGAAELLIAESPGGPYSEGALRSVYRGCGIEEAAERAGIRLNYGTDARLVECPDGIATKNFRIISPILDADVIVNLCKLKSHGLTMMSGAVKNYFGTVPGTEKFEMHARFPKIGDFSEMIVDLASMHAAHHDTLNIVDAVVGMEGNGPTGGKPRKIGALITSENPFSADLVGARLIGMSGKVVMLERGIERGLTDAEPKVIGCDPSELALPDFLPPDSDRTPILEWLATFWDGRLMKFFEPRPKINNAICVGCGECVRSCPVHTITLDKEKRRAVIHPEKCIKCFCCQELCPMNAVKVKQNFLIKLVK